MGGIKVGKSRIEEHIHHFAGLRHIDAQAFFRQTHEAEAQFLGFFHCQFALGHSGLLSLGE